MAELKVFGAGRLEEGVIGLRVPEESGQYRTMTRKQALLLSYDLLLALELYDLATDHVLPELRKEAAKNPPVPPLSGRTK